MAEAEKNFVVAKPGSSENGCVGNVAEHWSDLQIHYFCALPRVLRACYRTVVPHAVDVAASKGMKLALGENRRAALKACLDPKPGDLSESAQKAGYLFTKELNEFYKTQWVTNTAGERVNVFDYVMFAQTYAFDPEQEQAVLNAFYADMLEPKGKGEEHDLRADADACEKVRPRRALDTMPGLGGHCRTEKTLLEPLISLGR